MLFIGHSAVERAVRGILAPRDARQRETRPRSRTFQNPIVWIEFFDLDFRNNSSGRGVEIFENAKMGWREVFRTCSTMERKSLDGPVDAEVARPGKEILLRKNSVIRSFDKLATPVVTGGVQDEKIGFVRHREQGTISWSSGKTC